MNAKRRLSKWKISIFAVVLLCALIVYRYRQPSSVAVQPQATVAPVLVRTAEPKPEPAQMEAPPPAEPVKEPQVLLSPKAKDSPKLQAQNIKAQKPARDPLHDPDARNALALVGVDSTAEQYWLDAIYDSTLPDKEREDLMEDLNEAGFADPNKATADDLPLIVSRLQIIQQVLPNADDFMAPHLLEAEKDLANMYSQASQP